MARSFGVPNGEPAGSFTHTLSGSLVSIFWRGRKLQHKVVEQGLSADYVIAYSLGAGEVGRSYLIDLHGHLFQSPASYYTRRDAWGTSPGYESDHILDFNRPVGAECLFCHAGSSVTSKQHYSLTALSCERCHGPTAAHLRDPVAGNIVNPAKLPRRERDSICEQCHLEGATVVLNPGKHLWEFRPGQALEEIEIFYVYRTANGQPATSAFVSQGEQLAGSMCVRAGGGKLWCGSCHDPHGGGPPPNSPARHAQIRRVCETCHSQVELARAHKPQETDCVSCHMPGLRASDIAHAAITDHRILKDPRAQGSSKPIQMVAWYKTPAALADRNLGLAYFHVANQERSGADFERAYKLLTQLPHAQDDAPVQAALGYILLVTGHARRAVPYFDRAATASPASAEYWLDLGVAENAAGDRAAAIQSLRKSIAANRYDYRPYEALADLYASEGQLAVGNSVLREFLKVAPQSLTIRLLQNSTMFQGSGNR